MKNKILLLLLTVLPLLTFAQTFSGLTLKQAQEKAAKEKKIILVDVTNQRNHNEQKVAMQKKMATVKEVSDFMKKNCVLIRVFMDSPAGKEFAPLLQMSMYPTYAFLMPNGDLINTINPIIADREPQKFIDVMNKSWEKANNKWNNTRTINFKDLSFEEALALAKKEGKYLFIDAVTTNCQPCVKMAKDVFTQDKVADLYNENFINVKLNLGKERTDLAFRYRTSMYPTYLFLDGDGNLVHRSGGYREADAFIKIGEDALKNREVQFHFAKYDELLQIAKATNKNIFIDCYTTWCGPCKQMTNVVFKELPVADYFNTNFICAKFDMEKGEGIDLKKQFNVNAYPTFLIIDPSGKEIHRIVGSMGGKDFVEAVKQGAGEGSIARLRERYNSGVRDNDFILKYVSALDKANFKEDAKKISVELFKTVEPSFILEKQGWRLFDRYMNDYKNHVFQYVLDNRETFNNKIGKDIVERKLNNVWNETAKSFLVAEGEILKLDKKGYNAYKKAVRKFVADYNQMVFETDLYYAERMKDWKSYSTLMDKYIKKEGIEAIREHQFYLWMRNLEEKCDDKAIRNKAAAWCDIMLVDIVRRNEGQKAKSGGKMMALPMVNYEKELARIKELFLK